MYWQINQQISIDYRPQVADDKPRIGDLEIDTLSGKYHNDALVTVVERATNFTVSKEVSFKSTAAATKPKITLLKPLKNVVHTITTKNLLTMRELAMRWKQPVILHVHTVHGRVV